MKYVPQSFQYYFELSLNRIEQFNIIFYFVFRVPDSICLH